MSTAYNNIPKTITPYLLHVLRPHLALVAALLFKGLIWACLLPISSYALKLMVDSVSGVELPYSLAAYAGFYWISWAANPLNFRMVDWVRMRLYPALRIGIIDEMFTYLMEHDARFFQDHFAGDLSHKISDISGAAVAIYQTLEETFSNTMCIFIASGVMFFIDPRFCLIFLSWVVIITIVSALFSSKALALSKDFSDARSKSFGFIVDAVSNITAVKSFAKEIPEQERLEQQLKVTATCLSLIHI